MASDHTKTGGGCDISIRARHNESPRSNLHDFGLIFEQNEQELKGFASTFCNGQFRVRGASRVERLQGRSPKAV
jgi:hypothetical protein